MFENDIIKIHNAIHAKLTELERMHAKDAASWGPIGEDYHDFLEDIWYDIKDYVIKASQGTGPASP